MRRSLGWWMLLGGLIAGTPGRACTVFNATVIAGPNFRVRVENAGRPVGNLHVELHGSRAATDRVITDTNGVASFRNVAPGSYTLRAAHAAGLEGVAVQVNREESRELTVTLRWPPATLLSAASLKGVLHLPNHVPGQRQPGISLELLDGLSGRRLSTENTGENGAFDFPEVSPGIYFLRLRLSGSIDGGLIAVAVEPGAAAAPLEIDLAWTSCGLSYVDRRRCPQTDLHLDGVAGRVADSEGGAIAKADILLLGAGGELRQRTQSDDSGNFALFRIAGGTYRLQVQHAGFTTLRTTVTVNPGSARSSLEVKLGVAGACSTAR